MNGPCKAAGCHTREPKGASFYDTAPADRLGALGRLTGRGDEGTDEPFDRGRGGRGCTLGLFHVAGWDVLPGPRWPLGTRA